MIFYLQSCCPVLRFTTQNEKIYLIFGSSRACGCNHNKISIHAEQNAIDYCRKNDKRKNFEIYIWRYTKDGDLKSAHCCYSCTKLINKYGLSKSCLYF